MVLVFLTATYWFLDLVGLFYFDFVSPLANAIIGFMHAFYRKDIEFGGVSFDGSLLLFDLFSLGIVFCLTKIKIFIYRAMEYIQYSIDECLEKIENNFNSDLQKDMEKNIMQMSSIAVLVEFSAKSLMIDKKWGGDAEEGVKEKADEAFKEFYDALKIFPNCKFAKTDNKMIILLNNFTDIDRFLQYIDGSINDIREKMKKDRWLLSSYVAVEAYDKNKEFKEVYPTMQKLLMLRIQGEALCYGNFKLRYEMEPIREYDLAMKGKYSLTNTENVWSLMRKVKQKKY